MPAACYTAGEDDVYFTGIENMIVTTVMIQT